MNLHCIYLEIHASYFQDQSIAIKDKKVSILGMNSMGFVRPRACFRNLDLRVQSFFFIEESSEPQNPWVPIVLRASKSAGAKGDVPKFFGFVHPLHPC
jgi:hypothetical protein